MLIKNGTDNDLESTYCIDKPFARNEKYFVYKDKRYKINFDLLAMNCNYFFKNQDELKYVENIPLLNDDENAIEFPEESIESFISSTQNEKFRINKFSVHFIQYLSIKYEYSTLTKITQDFISTHSQDLVIQSLLFKMKMNKKALIIIDTKDDEENISKKFIQFIQMKELQELPIEILSRIFQRFYSLNENNYNNEDQSIIIDFLFKMLDKHGKEASILFNNIDFRNEKLSVVHRLISEYSDKFDFNMINSTLAKTTTELSSEMIKQKEMYSKIVCEMKNENEKQRKEIEKMKEEEKKRLNEMEERYQKRENEMKKELEKMKSDHEEQMRNIANRFEQMISEHLKIVREGKINQIERIIQTTMTVSDLKKLDKESLKYFTKEIVLNEKQNRIKSQNKSLIKQILIIYQLYIYLMAENQVNNIDLSDDDSFNMIIEFIMAYIDKPKIKFEALQKLYSKNVLESFIIDLINNFEYYLIEIKSSSDEFDSIMSIINNIQKQNPSISNNVEIIYEINSKSISEEKCLDEKQNDPICTLKMKYQEIDKDTFSSIADMFRKKLMQVKCGLKSIEFQYCLTITQISIPSSVTSICNYAFSDCVNLLHVTIPTSVTLIGQYAFSRCLSLSQLLIPISVKKIDEYAFQYCSSLQDIEIPSSVISIGSYAFGECSSMKSISFGESITSISHHVLLNCHKLKHVSIQFPWKSINYSFFCCCSSLKQIDIPSSVIEINDYAFYQCSSLTQITIPTSVNSIGDYAFEKCTSLAQLIILSSVISIGNYAFRDCTSLIKISIPSSAKPKSSSCFSGCQQILIDSLPSSFKLK